MIWNGGDDDDRNDGGPGNDTVTVNGANADEAFTLNASATPGEARFERAATPGPGPFNIDITASERLDLKANAGNDTFSSAGAIAALGLRADVQGGDGDDTVDGSDAADTLDGGAGNDRIMPDDNPAGTRDDARGGDGDDVIVWNGGDDDDLNEGGAGNDTSEVNGADADEKFTIKPSAAAGRVLFDRLAAPGPGAFSVDIGTTESLRLEANAGNDRIKGSKGVAGRIKTILNAGDGNDRVTGTDAIDAISLGKGSDIANAIDKAEDTVSCDQGIDLALVDRRDFVRQCELVIGGLPRVAIKGKPGLAGNKVALRLKCVATGEVQERRQAQAQRQADGPREGHAQARQDHDGGRRPQPPRPPRPLRRRPREGPGRVEGQAGQRLARPRRPGSASSPAARAWRALERARQVGGDPAAVEVAGLGADALLAQPARRPSGPGRSPRGRAGRRRRAPGPGSARRRAPRRRPPAATSK